MSSLFWKGFAIKEIAHSLKMGNFLIPRSIVKILGRGRKGGLKIAPGGKMLSVTYAPRGVMGLSK